MTDPHREEWADAVGAYLLEALPDDERAALEEHLAGCASCKEDVDFLRVASDALPASVNQLRPPPELKSRIMAVVNAEAELLAAASGPRADLPEPAPGRGWLRGLALRPGFALAATCLLLVVGGVTGALVAGEGGDSTRTVVAEVERARSEKATGRLVVHDSDSKLEVAGFPAPPEGRVYQVWLKRPGVTDPEPTSALFVPRSDGSGSVSVPGTLEGVEQVLVTDEPEGGSDAPTREPILSATLS